MNLKTTFGSLPRTHPLLKIIPWLVLLILLGTAPSNAGAASSGPGTWNLLLFGNYSPNSIDTENFSSSASYNNSLTALGKATSFNNSFQAGYGAGLAVVYWFNDTLAFRVGVQGNISQGKTGGILAGDSIQSAPIFGGLEAKLYGGADYFLYGVIDGGAAYEETVSGSSPTLSNYLNHGWSTYGDVGLGFNMNFLFVEVKLAYLPQAIPAAG
ncbi:MAG: hypothetical protein ACYCYP_02615, partial [Leptospirales bacterium]